MFGNVTVSALVANKVVGQFGASTAEVANTTGEGKKLAHAGWQLRTAGTGQLASLVITAGGTGYNNADLIRVASPTGGTNATATLTTNSTGGIATLTVTSNGGGFISVHPTASVTNSTGGTANGTGATITATAGGRAGRVHYECLVAMGTIAGDAADDAQLPE